MDMALSSADLAFQGQVRDFLTDELPDRLREGAARSPGVFVEPDIGGEWQAILHAKGWLATHWPVADGGTGWTPMQRYLFEKECALAGAPALAYLSEYSSALPLVLPLAGVRMLRCRIRHRLLRSLSTGRHTGGRSRVDLW